MRTETTRTLPLTNDRSYVEWLIRRVIDRCPERAPTSEQEHQSQRLLQDELSTRGIRTHLVPFRFSGNLYAVLALHFAVSVAGSVAYFFQPWLALALHSLAAISYLSEASHWGYILRRVFPFRRSQNLVGTLPSRGKPKLRIVMLGHADAAHTGLMFNPLMVSGTSNKPYPQPFGFVRKHMLFAVLGFALLGLIDLLLIVTGQGLPLLFYGLTFGSLVGLVLNLQVVLKNQIVPGASDNLTGCAALPVLAQRLGDKKPDDVELVFVVTGCEESGVGGSAALMHQMRGKWDKENTVIIGLDILTNGRLCYKTANEVLPFTLPAWLIETLQDVAARHEGIQKLGVYDACAGTDDAVPFIAKGYDSICLACCDDGLGVSREYHLMSDTPDNVDFDQMMEAIDYVEDVVDEIIDRRVKRPAAQQPSRQRRVFDNLEEKPQGLFDLLLLPAVWVVLAATAGAYCGSLLSLPWEASLSGLRGALSALLLLFPLVVLLDWLGWNPDKHLLGNMLALAIVSVVGISAVGLLLPVAAVAMMPQLAELPRGLAMLGGTGIGAAMGLPLAAIAWRLRRRFLPA